MAWYLADRTLETAKRVAPIDGILGVPLDLIGNFL
jgi:hypothetical protein